MVNREIRGEWQVIRDKDYSGGGYYRCNLCGQRYSFGAYHELNEERYCPNCGANMGSEEAEELRRVILCKDCKFFEVDHFSNIFGAPIIVAHNICGRLEIASKPDGFCFLAIPKDSEDLTKDNNKA